MSTVYQESLFEAATEESERSGSFVDNMKLPVHRWFRYSAGFSSQWVDSVLREAKSAGPVRLVDPFAGSGTTLICAEQAGVPSFGVEAHPFVTRVARAKLAYRSDPAAYLDRSRKVLSRAREIDAEIEHYSALVRRCFSDSTLASLDKLRRSVAEQADGSPLAELVWLTLVGILRAVSHVGTAPWQYVLPKKAKRTAIEPIRAFELMSLTVARDMSELRRDGPAAGLVQSDARTCEGVPNDFASLVITSPPYANNYDYADATRLEMTFFGLVSDWGDLQDSVRKHLMRSCSQHVTERTVDLESVLAVAELQPIHAELSAVCRQLGETRLERGGKKNYHLMAGCYFADMARVWLALRRVCGPNSRVCFVLGDSAPYGVYLPVVEWTAALALAAGFEDWSFEKLRDRNTKWKNRKHRVPLVEGRLWVRG